MSSLALLALVGIAIVAVVGIYHGRKALPAGVSFQGPVRHVPDASIEFLVDTTYRDADGKRQLQHEIFDRVLAMIERAEHFVLIDMFLLNPHQGRESAAHRDLSDELTATLIRRKRDVPEIQVYLISDPVNSVYGGAHSSQFERMRNNGIAVILTNLSPLRDSNPIYSSIWRLFIQWFGNSAHGGWVPHPFDSAGARVSLRSWLSLANMKANHRKVVVLDQPASRGINLTTLVTSANPHDASSAHSNVAFVVRDQIWRDALETEFAVARFSGEFIAQPDLEVVDQTGDVEVQLLTESGIRHRALQLLDATVRGDSIDMAMFYLAHRGVIQSLIDASNRGVAIRLLLDPNKDAFGYRKMGIPNRPVAGELKKRSKGRIEVRWCDTHGEQCHTKLTIVTIGRRKVVMLGSANFTRRNLDDYNLETDLWVEGSATTPALEKVAASFEAQWSNQSDRYFSVPYAAFADTSWYRTVIYRIQEFTGLSSF